ncbi:TPA: SDR family NAD(P)-dependent oxidoreductase, partial [Legionella pneumophila]|nr:SDR family NAD(P)-dependent oxidoreductase [Legionella pneumophila]
MNILITGGSSDIAQAIAKRRSESGDKIIITC